MPPKGEMGAYKRKNGISDAYYYEVLESIEEGVHDERIHTKNKSVHEIRRSGIHTGWTVTICNDIRTGLDMSDLNYEWYVQEVEKLVKPLRG